MKALKFTLSGKTAFFKLPEVNKYQYFTYGQVHWVALLGILGAILGYAGYNALEGPYGKKRRWPEFYDRLKGLNISITPNSNKGIFSQRLQKFNNSTAFASKEEGGNLIISQVWLEDVSWDIYVLLDSEEAEKLAESMLNHQCVYIPYLGSNDHPADIRDVEVIEVSAMDEVTSINSLAKSCDISYIEERKMFKYEERLPIGLEADTELYIDESFIFTNGRVEIIRDNLRVYKDKERNLLFYAAEGVC